MSCPCHWQRQLDATKRISLHTVRTNSSIFLLRGGREWRRTRVAMKISRPRRKKWRRLNFRGEAGRSGSYYVSTHGCVISKCVVIRDTEWPPQSSIFRYFGPSPQNKAGHNYESRHISHYLHSGDYKKIMRLKELEYLELPASADMHVHLRQGKLMDLVVPQVRKGGVDTVFVMVEHYPLYISPYTHYI